MKNAMKKLTSLLLVALLLVGMIPFAASAATFDVSIDVDGKNALITNGGSVNYSDCENLVAEDRQIVKIVYEGEAVDGTKTLNAGESVTLEGVTRFFVFTQPKPTEPSEPEQTRPTRPQPTEPSEPEQTRPTRPQPTEPAPSQPTAYKVNIYVNRDKKLSTTGTSVSYADCVSCVNTENCTIKGITYSVRRGEKNALKEGESVTLTADTDFFVSVERKNDRPNNNWHDNDKNENNNNHNNNHDNNWHDKNENTNKFPYNVYLNIYKDSLVGSPDKQIDITNGIALDGLVSLSEVKTVVSNYYSAKNSNGIGYDGLYLAKGNWVADYVADTHKYSEIKTESLRQNGYVYINVMISNATTKTTYTADSSNPKTGDSIYTAMTVMGISAAALASVMYFYNKKRMAM